MSDLSSSDRSLLSVEGSEKQEREEEEREEEEREEEEREEGRRGVDMDVGRARLESLFSR